MKKLYIQPTCLPVELQQHSCLLAGSAITSLDIIDTSIDKTDAVLSPMFDDDALTLDVLDIN
jgi:hypothetical protein